MKPQEIIGENRPSNTIIDDERMNDTLVIFCHIISYGGGNGNGFCAARKPSRWHMLSYASTTLSHLCSGRFLSKLYSHISNIMNTCDGDSDLKELERIITTCRATYW